MGRSCKPFIDKKRSTTYSLVFRSTENDEDAGPERVLVPVDEAAGPAAAVGAGAPPSEPRALYRHFFGGDDDDDSGGEADVISEARRRELLEYGFADDGYDYLKHCRVIGRGSASLQQQQPAPAHQQQQQQQPRTTAACEQQAGAGASSSAAAAAAAAAPAAAEPAAPAQATFLRAPRVKAPAPDVKLVDARRVAPAAAGAAGAPPRAPVLALASAAAAPAAARRLGGRELAGELAELEQLMAAAEAASEAGDAAGEAGLGDLLDDFVLEAAAGAEGEQQAGAVPARAAAAAVAAAAAAAATSSSDEGEGETFSSELSDGEPPAAPPPHGRREQPPRAGAAGPPEPRGPLGDAAFGVLSEQFDALLAAYGDEQLGDLEGDARAAGRLVPSQLAGLVAHGGAGAPGPPPGWDEGGSEGDEAGSEGDDYFPSGSGSGSEAGSCEPGAGTGGRGRRGGGSGIGRRRFKPLRVAGGPFEPRVECLEERDPAVIAAVRARLAAAEAAGPSGGGGEGSGEGGGVLEGEELTTVLLPARERWDCESVVSRRSVASHFPAKIASEPGRSRHSGPSATGGVIRLNPKTGLPSGYGSATLAAAAGGDAPPRLTPATLAAAAAGADGGSSSSGSGCDEGAPGAGPGSVATSIYERPRGESADERRARKGAVKAAQREARATKKALRQLYAAEASRQQRQQAAAPRGSVVVIP